MGGEFLTIRVNTLDDVSNDEILQGPIHYLDGKNPKILGLYDNNQR